MQSPTHFRFREDNFAWSPSTNQTAYMYFCNSTAHFKKLLGYGEVHAQSPSYYHIKSRRCNQLQCSGGFRGGARPPLPPYLSTKMRPKGQKNFWGRPTPPPNLRVWMTGPPTYLKVWICHCNALQMTTKIGADNDLPFFHHFLSVSCHPCEL